MTATRPTGWAASIAAPGSGGGVRELGSALLVAVWVAVTLSQVAVSFSGPKTYTPITEGTEPLPAWVDRVETVCDALVLLACAVTAVVAWRRGGVPRQPWLLVVLLAPWAVLVVRQLLVSGTVGPGVLPYVALAVAFWSVRPGLGVVQVLGYLTVAGATLAVALALLAPDHGLYVGGPGYLAEKPVGPWGILAGFLPTGNNMGRFLAIGLPSVLALRNPGHRVAGLALTLVALIWTASRTSLAVALLVLAALLVLHLAGRAGAVVRRRVAAAGLVAVAATGAVVPFVVTSPEQLNFRAGFWTFLLDRWRASPWFGESLDYFERLAEQPDNLGGYAYHAHNLTVQTLVTGGLLSVLAVGAVLVVAGRRAVRLAGDGELWAVLALAAVLAAGVLEVPLSFADAIKANLPGVLVVLLVVLTRAGAGAPPAGADPRSTPDITAGKTA